jgi:hypothetical protein
MVWWFFSNENIGHELYRVDIDYSEVRQLGTNQIATSNKGKVVDNFLEDKIEEENFEYDVRPYKLEEHNKRGSRRTQANLEEQKSWRGK